MPIVFLPIGSIASAAVNPPDGPAFDLVLLAHIGCAVLAILTVVVSGVQAERLRRSSGSGEIADNLRTYYRPGFNWAGRTLHAVPILGFILLGMSHGAFGLDDGWVMAGFGIWTVAALMAEGVLWPAERRLQTLVTTSEGSGVSPKLVGDCTKVRLAAWGLVIILIAAMVVMTAQP